MPKNRLVRLVTLLAVPIAVLGAGVVYATGASAVANGEVVAEGDYRFSVKLTMTGIPTDDNGGRRNSACSGALVAPQWVITAGHCFRDFNNKRPDRPVADLTMATVGRARIDGKGGADIEVVAVRQSPTADVALAKLKRPVRGVRPLRLANRAPEPGDVVRLTGFGSVSGVDPTPSNELRTGQFTVAEVADSTVLVSGFKPQPDTSPCPFDSGAPYFAESRFGQPRLVAIENTGPGCPHAERETTARIDNIRGWIGPIIRG